MRLIFNSIRNETNSLRGLVNMAISSSGFQCKYTAKFYINSEVNNSIGRCDSTDRRAQSIDES